MAVNERTPDGYHVDGQVKVGFVRIQAREMTHNK